MPPTTAAQYASWDAVATADITNNYTPAHTAYNISVAFDEVVRVFDRLTSRAQPRRPTRRNPLLRELKDLPPEKRARVMRFSEGLRELACRDVVRDNELEFARKVRARWVAVYGE